MKTTLLALIASLPLICASAAPAAPAAMADGSIQPATLPPINSVREGVHGQFLVNGAPFFPILLYDTPTDAATLAQFHDMGFNVVTTPKPEDAAKFPAAGFYAGLHASAKAANLHGVLLALGVDSPALNYPKDTIKTTVTENAKAGANAPGRPVMSAIGYWDNEPQGVKNGKILTADKYDDIVKAIDVSAPYLYPVPYQPVSTVADAVARAKAATGGKKTVLPILQIFNLDAKDRYPTPQELRCMVFASLIEGANGIGYYSYGYVTGAPKKTIAEVQPELWKSLKETNADAAKIGAFFATARPNAAATAVDADPAIKFRAGTGEHGRSLLVVANTSDKPVSVKFKGTGTPADSEGVSLTAFGTAAVWGK